MGILTLVYALGKQKIEVGVNIGKTQGSQRRLDDQMERNSLSSLSLLMIKAPWLCSEIDKS
jgi:hypothetical protein